MPRMMGYNAMSEVGGHGYFAPLLYVPGMQWLVAEQRGAILRVLHRSRKRVPILSICVANLLVPDLPTLVKPWLQLLFLLFAPIAVLDTCDSVAIRRPRLEGCVRVRDGINPASSDRLVMQVLLAELSE